MLCSPKLTNTYVSAQLKPCYVHIQISFSRGSGVSVPKWIVGGSYLLYNKYDLLMVTFFSIWPPNSEDNQPTPSSIFSSWKKKRNKRTRENLTYLLCMTQILIIAICVQVLCLVVDDVRWHVCWCDMTLGEEQPSTDGTCQWINSPWW